MNTICPRCNSIVEPNSSFCTSCGTVLAGQTPYQQSGTQYAAPNPYQQSGQQSQVPPWATTGNPGYGFNQQSQQAGGSLGFGGQGNAATKKIITVAVAVIAITIVLLVAFGLLALFVPGLRCLFVGFIVLLFVIPWFIYSYIRNLIRRSVGGIGRFI